MPQPFELKALDGIPLRERKYARTRLALAEALVGALAEHSLEEVPVKAICAAAEVSEATFFNYFPRKTDLMLYCGQLWFTELAWHARRVAAEQGPGLAVIDEIFQQAARQIQARPQVMGEIIALYARLREKPELPEVSAVERVLAFPDLNGIEEVQVQGIESLLSTNLQRAIHRGELPGNTHASLVMVSLVSIFYGVPLVLHLANPGGIGSGYRQQLALLWAGVRGLTQR